MDRPELQKASTKLGTNLEGLASALSGQRQLFTSLHVYPLPVFPGHTQEGLLQQLVRKKLDVKAEDWIEESVGISKEQQSNGEAGALSGEDMKELWSSAGDIQRDIFKRLSEDPGWDDVYTIREREEGVQNVVTGLKRDLDDSEDEEEDGEDEDGNVDKMDVSDVKQEQTAVPGVNGMKTGLPPLPLDSMLKYAHGQDVP